MIVCPVCEHAQAPGAECEVCGKVLLPGGEIPAPAPLDGLEPTRLPALDAGVERLAELEPTRHRPAAEAPPDPTPDVERTAAAPVDVDAALVADLEPTRSAVPGDAPTAVPTVITCRYCRTPATPGERVCGRCGMRLPSFAAAGEAAATGARRCSCGLLVAGAVCPGCGARS